jgi:hypothetical protein
MHRWREGYEELATMGCWINDATKRSHKRAPIAVVERVMAAKTVGCPLSHGPDCGWIN